MGVSYHTSIYLNCKYLQSDGLDGKSETSPIVEVILSLNTVLKNIVKVTLRIENFLYSD